MTTIQTITIPDIGDYKDVPVVEISVQVGDMVASDDTLILLESDKATLDVPSPVVGRVKEVLVTVRQTVSMGEPFIVLELDAAGADLGADGPVETSAPEAPPAPVEAIENRPSGSVAEPAAKSDALAQAEAPAIGQGASLYHASPSVRRFGRELGVDLTLVIGTGPHGRISKEDVQSYVKARLADPVQGHPSGNHETGLSLLTWPKVDFAKFGPIERVKLSRIRRISGPNLQRNSTIIPHVTNFEDADITDLEAFRVSVNKENEKSGRKLTILPFVVKAAVAALKKFPSFNSSLDGEELIQKGYYNIGFAADTPDGLVVPVIKDADKKSIFEIAEEAVYLAGEARSGKLKLEDMQGGTFTISSLGGVGGTNFTPIVNAPEVAILGMTRAQIKPVWDGAGFQPRLIQPLSLSWDHRVVDGVGAAHFLVLMSRILSDYRRIIL